MAGIVSPSMPVYIVENPAGGTRAYSTLNEGYGKVLRYGAYGEDVLARLRWIEQILAPVLGRALQLAGGIDLKTLIAQALTMGDEGHNRTKAGSALFGRLLGPHLVRTGAGTEPLSEIFHYLAETDLAVLNPVMAACKATMDAGHGIPGSTLVTAMARNGTEFGIRVSGLGDRWFVGPAEVPRGLYFPGFTAEDANPDVGDSTITETAEQVAVSQREWTHREPPGVPGGQDFDVIAGWRAVGECIRDALRSANNGAGADGAAVAAVAATRMRAGMGLFARAGRAIAGFVRVEQMVGQRRAGLLVVADEAEPLVARDRVREVERVAGGQPRRGGGGINGAGGKLAVAPAGQRACAQAPGPRWPHDRRCGPAARRAALGRSHVNSLPKRFNRLSALDEKVPSGLQAEAAATDSRRRQSS